MLSFWHRYPIIKLLGPIPRPQRRNHQNSLGLTRKSQTKNHTFTLLSRPIQWGKRRNAAGVLSKWAGRFATTGRALRRKIRSIQRSIVNTLIVLFYTLIRPFAPVRDRISFLSRQGSTSLDFDLLEEQIHLPKGCSPSECSPSASCG